MLSINPKYTHLHGPPHRLLKLVILAAIMAASINLPATNTEEPHSPVAWHVAGALEKQDYRIDVEEWHFGLFPRATFRVISTDEQKDQLLGMADVPILDFEQPGLLTHRLRHELTPAIAKAKTKNRHIVQLHDFEDHPDLGLALALRLDAEPHLCGEGISGRLHHLPWRFAPAEKAFYQHEVNTANEAPIIIKPSQDSTTLFEIQRKNQAININIADTNSDIEAAEKITTALNQSLGKEKSLWNRDQALSREQTKARWAIYHGFAIEAALAADRAILLGDDSIEMAEWRMQAYALTTIPVWLDLYHHAPHWERATTGGTNTGAYPSNVVDVRTPSTPPASPLQAQRPTPLQSSDHLEAAIHAVSLIPAYLQNTSPLQQDPDGREIHVPHVLQPLAVSGQTMLAATRVLRSHWGQNINSPRIKILQDHLHQAFHAGLHRLDHSTGAAFFVDVASRGIPWWYQDSPEKFEAFSNLFANASNIHADLGPLREGDLEPSGMFKTTENLPDPFTPLIPQGVPPIGQPPAIYQKEWISFLILRATREDLDFETRATAWALLAAIWEHYYLNTPRRNKTNCWNHVEEAEKYFQLSKKYSTWVLERAKKFVWDQREEWLDRKDVPHSIILIWQSGNLHNSTSSLFDHQRLAPLIEKRMSKPSPQVADVIVRMEKDKSNKRATDLRNWLAKLIAKAENETEERAYHRTLDALFYIHKDKKLKPVDRRWPWPTPLWNKKIIRQPEYGNIKDQPALKAKLWLQPSGDSGIDNWVGNDGKKIWFWKTGKLISVQPSKNFHQKVITLPPPINADNFQATWSMQGPHCLFHFKKTKQLHLFNATTGKVTKVDLPFPPDARLSLTPTKTKTGQPAFLVHYSGQLSIYTCGRAAWLPIGGGACLVNAKTGKTTLFFDTRRYPGTNALETGDLIWPQGTARTNTGNWIIDAQFAYAGAKRFLFHGAPNGQDWRKGRPSQPHYANIAALYNSGNKAILNIRSRFSNVMLQSAALLDDDGTDKVDLLYRSHDSLHQNLKVFPEEETSHWGNTIGYPRTAFTYRQDQPNLAAFYKPEKLGLEQEDGSIIWHEVELPITDEQHKIIAKEFFFAENWKKQRAHFNSITPIKGGYIIYPKDFDFKSGFFFLPHPEK